MVFNNLINQRIAIYEDKLERFSRRLGLVFAQAQIQGASEQDWTGS